MANTQAITQTGLTDTYSKNIHSSSSPHHQTDRDSNSKKHWQWLILEIEDISNSASRFRVDDVIADTISVLSRVATPKGIDIIFTPNPEAIAHSDPDITYSMSHYLLSNLVKLSQRGETIRISSKIDQNIVLISITNVEIGMNKEKLDQLFKVNSDSTSMGLVGDLVPRIELLLCQNFARENIGVLSVISGETQGVTFTFTLPKVT
ncbi:sensor histidine kinase KdpD [Synechococcus sp. PCC 7502]|uniref:sensor histidine kinase n=1 Tax=Synechococcus sp. PCC 7502 TaxID=1173263 RepID=UPI0002F40CD9|nr:HAMP domain-containing sensor histidine kinase [Synechococcus sp. PCC 7502]